MKLSPEKFMQTDLFTKRTFLVIDDFGEMRSMIKGLLRLLGAYRQYKPPVRWLAAGSLA